MGSSPVVLIRQERGICYWKEFLAEASSVSAEKRQVRQMKLEDRNPTRGAMHERLCLFENTKQKKREDRETKKKNAPRLTSQNQPIFISMCETQRSGITETNKDHTP